jgi:hypothetical protein
MVCMYLEEELVVGVASCVAETGLFGSLSAGVFGATGRYSGVIRWNDYMYPLAAQWLSLE